METLIHGDSDLGSVLLVEDDDDDTFLLQRAFGKAQVEHSVLRFGNANEAIEHLSNPSQRLLRRGVRLLVTDLHMPGMDGLEFLAWLRAKPEFDGFPKIVLSSSAREEDFDQSLAVGAAAYFVKPVEFDNLTEIVQSWKQSYLKDAPASNRL